MAGAPGDGRMERGRNSYLSCIRCFGEKIAHHRYLCKSVISRYIIYNVSKEEYDSCRISQTDPRVVAVCDKPDRQLQFTITFRWDCPAHVSFPNRKGSLLKQFPQ